MHELLNLDIFSIDYLTLKFWELFLSYYLLIDNSYIRVIDGWFYSMLVYQILSFLF